MSIYGNASGGQATVIQAHYANNANKLDNKDSTEFASASDVSTLSNLVGDQPVSEQINDVIANKIVKQNVVLYATSWSSNTQTITVSGVTSGNAVIVSPAPTSHNAYLEADIRCTGQATDGLTFTCASTPSADLTVNVVILT